MPKPASLPFEQEAGSPPAFGALNKMRALIKEAAILSETMEELEESLKSAKQRYNEIKMKLLPDAMTEAQTSDWTDDITGNRVVRTKFVSGSFPKTEPARTEALEWLTENDGGSLLTSTVSVEFKRSEHNLAVSVF